MHPQRLLFQLSRVGSCGRAVTPLITFTSYFGALCRNRTRSTSVETRRASITLHRTKFGRGTKVRTWTKRFKISGATITPYPNCWLGSRESNSIQIPSEGIASTSRLLPNWLPRLESNQRNEIQSLASPSGVRAINRS